MFQPINFFQAVSLHTIQTYYNSFKKVQHDKDLCCRLIFRLPMHWPNISYNTKNNNIVERLNRTGVLRSELAA